MEEVEPGTLSQRQKAGRLLFRVGVCLLAIATIAGTLAVTASALSYSQEVVADLGILSGVTLVIGLLAVAVGVIAWKMPRGIEGDALWVLKTGPFIRFWQS